jgi:cytochrome c oxidase subunit III
MKRRTLDVAALPTHAFGPRGLVWWGTVGFMVIEGSIFITALITYFFLRTRETQWPPGLPDPDPTFGTINLLVMLASGVPNQMAKSAAEAMNLARVRVLMLVCLAFGIAFLVIRVFEFSSLGAMWDSNAYGSIVWVIMAMHTSHLLTDVLDSIVLTALVFTAHVEPRRLVDVSDNALYWYFVVFSWIPIYLVVYFAPRWL